MRKGAAWGKLTSRAWKVSLSPWMYKGQNASVISSLVLDNTALLKTGWLHNYRATGRRASNSTPRTYVCLVVQPSLRKSHLLKLWITDKILCQNGESLWHLLSDLASTLHQGVPSSGTPCLTIALPNGPQKGSPSWPFDLGFPHCYLTRNSNTSGEISLSKILLLLESALALFETKSPSDLISQEITTLVSEYSLVTGN